MLVNISFVKEYIEVKLYYSFLLKRFNLFQMLLLAAITYVIFKYVTLIRLSWKIQYHSMVLRFERLVEIS